MGSNTGFRMFDPYRVGFLYLLKLRVSFDLLISPWAIFFVAFSDVHRALYYRVIRVS